jgi:hypothetical protein
MSARNIRNPYPLFRPFFWGSRIKKTNPSSHLSFPLSFVVVGLEEEEKIIRLDG